MHSAARNRVIPCPRSAHIAFSSSGRTVCLRWRGNTPPRHAIPVSPDVVAPEYVDLELGHWQRRVGVERWIPAHVSVCRLNAAGELLTAWESSVGATGAVARLSSGNLGRLVVFAVSEGRGAGFSFAASTVRIVSALGRY